ncbi:MAG: hypothetical protein QOE32_7641, partial [Pseudonocardiales bacterium]|nr:hypothetical protein [Pseudonocardiales bacterium]
TSGTPARASPAARRVIRAAAGLLTLAGGVALAHFLPVWIAAAGTWAAANPDKIRSLVAALAVSAAINYRTVWLRRTTNAEKGQFTRPVFDALWSAGGALLVTVSFTLVKAIPAVGDLADVNVWFAAGVGAVAGLLGSAIQRRTAGGQRTWNGVLAAVNAIPTTVVMAALSTSSAPASWGAYISVGVAATLLVAPSTLITDWTVWQVGRGLGWLSDRRLRKLDEKGEKPATLKHNAKIKKENEKAADLKRWGPPDYRTVLHKMPDAILGALFTYLIVRPLVGVPETWPVTAARVVIVVGLLAVSWRHRNVWDAAAKLLGYSSDRTLTPRGRPLLPIARVRQRIGPVERQAQAMLEELTGEQLADGHPLDDATAEQVAEELVAAFVIEPAVPGSLSRLLKEPALRELARKTIDEYLRRHREQQRLNGLVLLLMASNRHAFLGAAQRAEGQAGRVLAFQHKVFEVLLRTDNLEKLRLPTDSAQLLRGEVENLLRDALDNDKKEREKYLTNHLIPLRHASRDRFLHGSPEDQKLLKAQEQLLIAEGQLLRQQQRKVDDRGPVAARDFLTDRRRGILRAIVREQARLRALRETASPVPSEIAKLEELITGLRRIDTALRYTLASVALADEVELHRNERTKWIRALGAAVSSGTPMDRGSALGLLLHITGSDTPVTVADAATWSGRPEDEVRTQLEQLVGLGALGRDEAGVGYSAEDRLLQAWRGTDPMLRHALRTNPTVLPVGRELEPLTRTDLDMGRTPDEARLAYARLLEILAGLERVVLRHHSLGLVDDLMQRWNRRWAADYEATRPLGRVSDTPRTTPGGSAHGPGAGTAGAPGAGSVPARSQRAQVRELRNELRALIAEARAAEAASRRSEPAAQRPRGGVDPDPAPTTGPRPGRLDQESDAQRQARLEHYARWSEWEQVYRRLNELVTRIRKQDYDSPAALPPMISRQLAKADRLLAVGPGTAGPGVPAQIRISWALRAVREADHVLAEAQTRLGANPDSPEARAHYADALAQANVALAMVYDATVAATQEQITNAFLPRRHLDKARGVMARLLQRDREHLLAEPIGAPPAERGSRVSRGTAETREGEDERGAGSAPFVLRATGPDRQVAAGLSDAGGRPQEDGVEAHYDPATGELTVVLGDGVAGSHSNRASRAAVKAAMDHLLEMLVHASYTGRHELAHAHALAWARLAALQERLAGAYSQPATTTLTLSVRPDSGTGTTTVTGAGLGDTVLFWLPERRTGGAPRRLNGVHLDADGRLTTWLGVDGPHTAAQTFQETFGTPGVLVA